jgi:hypothetical protein
LASQINASNSGFGGIVSTGDSSGVLQLQTVGTTAITVDTSQNVGIGTTSPAAKLDIGSGNLNFSSTAQRITGDMSSATAANRVAFQTNTTNGNTVVGAIPNGTSVTSVFRAFNNSDPANAGQATFGLNTSNIIIESGITGTGSYVPIAFSTGGSERMRIDTSGNLLFNSGYGSAATAYGCRAWVNFNGTGTVAIRGSGNVTSITDNGTGDYTVNLTTAMPDVNYAFTQHISCASTGAVNDGCDLQSIATGSFRILCGNGGTALDANYAMFSIFR